MEKQYRSKPYSIHISYGNADLKQLIDNLARRTIVQQISFVHTNHSGKKSKQIRQTV